MATLTSFVAQLLTSVVDLVVIFVTQVALRDPLAFVSFLMGGLLVTVSVAFFGYLTLGAVFSLFSGDGGSLGRTPPPQAK